MTSRATQTATLADRIGVLLRWGLAVLFIYMGLQKAVDPVGFLKLVREYHVVTHPVMLNVIAATLPWVEVCCGILLLLGIGVRGTAVLLALMLLPFTALVIHRAVGIADLQRIAFCAVKFDCGCGAGDVYICKKILENALLTLCAAFLAAGYGKPACLRHSLFGRAQVTAPPEL